MKFVVLCSGNGTNFENILRTVHRHEVVLMIHNKEKCGAVKRAAKFGVPHIHIPHDNEDLMIRTIRAFHPDLIVLAGYMRILSSRFVGSFDRIINVHPSLLPKYKGLNTHEKVINNGDEIHGCSTHFVTCNIDEGPIIAQYRLPVDENDTAFSISKKLLPLEHKLYYETLKMIEEKRVYLRDNKVIFDGKFLNEPIMFN